MLVHYVLMELVDDDEQAEMDDVKELDKQQV